MLLVPNARMHNFKLKINGKGDWPSKKRSQGYLMKIPVAMIEESLPSY